MRPHALFGLLAALAAPALAAPPLSPRAQAALDQTAKRALTLIQQRSIREGREYCGYIFRLSETEFRADKPRHGQWAGCTLRGLADEESAIASYHTHGNFSLDADSEVPSVLDLTSDMADDMIGYVATPGGRFWRTNMPTAKAVQLCGRGCLFSDPAYEDDPSWGAMQKIFTLPQLEARQSD